MLVMIATRGREVVKAAVELAGLGDERPPCPSGCRRRAAARCRRRRSSGRPRTAAGHRLIIAVVVDLPCVPATATPSRSCITCPSSSAYLIVGIRSAGRP